jgi:hypothetical protein
VGREIIESNGVTEGFGNRHSPRQKEHVHTSGDSPGTQPGGAWV